MRWLSAILILAVIGCGRERRPPSVVRDFGPRDVGTADAGDPNDAGDPSDASDPNDASGPSDASDPADANAMDATADSGTADSGFRLCAQSCSTPSDCVPADNALQDADNWLCNFSHCEYRGCLSTQECAALFG